MTCALRIIKPAFGLAVSIVLFISSVLNPYPVVLLSEEHTDEGTELTGTVGNLDWTAVLREIKTIDGGRFRKINIRVKDGDTEEQVEVDFDTRLKPGPVKSVLDYIKYKI